MTYVLATIFVLGVLVFIHELGHFLVAKWVGIKVLKFSLGFPPSIISKKWGETEYALGLIPLGGYVKMAGENPAEESSGAPYEFMSKKVWQRFLVIFAGPFMNFVLAVVVLAGLFFFRGQEVPEVYIGSVSEGGPAAMAGIVEGDRIVSVAGEEVTSFRGMASIIYEKIEEPLEIVWMHGDETKTATMLTYRDMVATSSGDSVAVGKIGIGSMPVFKPMGFFPAVNAGFNQSVFYVKMVFSFVLGLITRTVDLSDVGGPIFIGQLAGDTAKAGFDVLLEFLALLSVNLAVLNILPIPVFDGGHLIFLIIEKIKGSPLSLKTRMMAQQVGIAFILILVVFVFYNDINRIRNMFF